MTDSDFDNPFAHSTAPPAIEFGQHKPVGGVGAAAAVLVGAATVLSAVDTWSDWHRYNVLHDFLARDSSLTKADLNSADRIAALTGLLALGGLIAAGVVFVIWLWRARQNAELTCEAEHRRSTGWIIFGWIVPVVNLWFPYMIMDDVYRASRPDNPSKLYNLRQVPGSTALGWWWGLWVTSQVTDRIAEVNLRGNYLTEANFQFAAVVGTVSTLALAGAAVVIVPIMREISAWQAPRLAT